MIGDQKFSMRPLYLQVRDFVLERITNGTWKPGAMLPAEVDLARELGISSGTVRKALDALEAEHVVSRRQGKGTFVNDSSVQELVWRYDNLRDGNGQRIAGVLGAAEASVGPASEMEQERLQLAADSRVVRIRRVHVNADHTYMHEEVALPERYFPGLAERTEMPQRIADLAQEFGLVLGRGLEHVSVATAGPEIAGSLGIAEGTPVLKLDRLVCAIDGPPVEWRVATCHLVDERYVIEFD
ncbi:MAG: GntR family transcriptional regulator [Hyphomicrobiaceae bacterium]